MAVSTLRPSSQIAGSGNFTITGGAASQVIAINDSNTATGILKTTTATGTARTSFYCATGVPTLSGSQKVKRVRIRVNTTSTLATSKFDAQVGVQVSGAISYSTALAVRGVTTLTASIGGWYQYAPDGNPWDQTRLNGIIAQFTEYNDYVSGADARVTLWEAYVDVDVANQPTVTPSNPSTSATCYPTITWTYTDSDGDAQEYYQIKVFTSAQYGAVGFSASTSTAFYDSGQIYSGDNTAVVSTAMPADTYKVYVRAGKTVAGSPFYSDWTTPSAGAFTMAFGASTPTTPTLTASYVSSTNSVSLVATGAIYSAGTQTYQIQRSNDSGVTWSDVRTASASVPDGSYVVNVSDYEALRNNVAQYRVRSIGVVGANYFATVWSSVASTTISNDGNWWFKVLNTPSYNMGGLSVTNGISENVTETAGVFHPIGRTSTVVVANDVYGEDGNYNIILTNDADYNLFYSIAVAQSKILVQDPYGTQKYVRFNKRSWDMGGTSGRRMRQVKIDYVEVSAT